MNIRFCPRRPGQKPAAGMRHFLVLWSTQAFSALGSAMTSFALIVWSYQQEGSALTTALLSVCSYAPYVALGMVAGALIDRGPKSWDKKRIMLVCDSLAAAATLVVLLLLTTGRLRIGHLYALNAVGGLMNAFQQPASDVAVSLLAPKEQYQRVGALQSLSHSLVTILGPLLASSLLALGGMRLVILADLLTFGAAFLTLAFFIRIPRPPERDEGAGVLDAVRDGLRFLKRNRGILDLILFLAAINLIASLYNAALPAMLLSRQGGGQAALGLVNACSGAANVAGSVAVSLCRPPKSRVRVICNALLFSMSTENLLLALGRSLPVWCVGAVLGWLLIPVMNANMNALLRSRIPVELQGRVYAARNTLQFFTIPVGYLLGGVLVDKVCEPLMAAQPPGGPLVLLLGEGKGSGAALLYLALAAAGVLVCLAFRRDKAIWALEKDA